MKIAEMKELIRRYEDALEIIEKHSNEYFVTSVARAALGIDVGDVINKDFERTV